MKKDTTIRAQLGLTQHEMAMLLGVSRSLLSLYELGQRDLPLRATLLLAEILTYFQSAEQLPESAKSASCDHASYLKQRLTDNRYEQRLLEKKIETAVRKQKAESNRLRLSAFLNQQKKDYLKAAPQFLLADKLKPKGNDYAAAQFKYAHQLELLMLEKTVLEAKLQSAGN